MTRRLAIVLVVVAILAGTAALYLTRRPAVVPPPLPITGTHVVAARDGRILLDGEPFFVRGVGYEAGCRPGNLPWERKFEPEVLRHDFLNIRRAGFNAIRTWAPMTDSELVVAAEHGLWVIQGIWTDWNRFWTDSSFHAEAVRTVEHEVERSSRHPNILFYLVMNEPAAEVLFKAGDDAVRRGFQDLADAVRRADSDALVSFSNCPLTDYLDTEPWDIVCSNNYVYAPEAVNYAAGYRGYTEWLVRRSGAKPYLTTEFGLSVSPEGPGKFGYGGNTLEEQAEGVVSMYRDIVAAGAAGAAPFMWVDGWWKSPTGGEGNQNRHEPHPEEWFGLNEVSPQEYLGRPRPVVAALSEFNRLIVLAPRAGVAGREIEVRAVAPWAPVRARLEGGVWQDLRRVGHDEWGGRLTASVDGPVTIEFEAGDANRRVPVLVRSGGVSPALHLRLDSTVVSEGEPALARFRLEDPSGASIENRRIFVSMRTYPSGFNRTAELKTDAQGEATLRVGTLGQTGIIGIAGGVDVAPAGASMRIADMNFLRVAPHPDPMVFTKGRRPLHIEAFEFASTQAAQEAFRTIYLGPAQVEVGLERSSLALTYRPESPFGWVYLAARFAGPVDIGEAGLLSYLLEGDDPSSVVKVMLIDQDGERWFQGTASPRLRSARPVLWDLNGDLLRDPFDGIKTGNNRFDRNQVSGIAVVVTGPVAAKVRLSKLTVWH